MSRKKGGDVDTSTIQKTLSYENEKGKTQNIIFLIYFLIILNYIQN